MIRNYTKPIIIFLLGVFLNIYFTYHLFEGNRGINKLKVFNNQYEKINKEYEKYSEDYLKLECRVNLIKPESLDLDMLDERCREVLNVSKENDILIVLK